MPRRSSNALTPRESTVMQILWEKGIATADQVRERLPDEPHDSTVRTVLRVLVRKGHVRRIDQDAGIAYQAITPRPSAQMQAVRQMLRQFFAGSAQDLVLRLLEDEALTLDDLERIRRQRRESS